LSTHNLADLPFPRKKKEKNGGREERQKRNERKRGKTGGKKKTPITTENEAGWPPRQLRYCGGEKKSFTPTVDQTSDRPDCSLVITLIELSCSEI
jgi:hypothetical protein